MLSSPGLSHRGRSCGTGAAGGSAASPWVRPSRPAPPWLPIPFPCGQRGLGHPTEALAQLGRAVGELRQGLVVLPITTPR